MSAQWKPVCKLEDIPPLGARRVHEGCTPKFSVKVDGGQVNLKAQELDTLAIEPLAPAA
jgi:nitrite reductase/ring-hydroxylating ferredoxin subunit